MIELSNYPFLEGAIIFFMIAILAFTTCYIFKIVDFVAIMLMFCLYIVLFYAFGILNLNWLSAGLILFAICVFIVFGRKVVNKEGE